MPAEEYKEKFAAAFAFLDQQLSTRQKAYSQEAVKIGFTRNVLSFAASQWLSAAAADQHPLSTASALSSAVTLGEEAAAINKAGTVGQENIPLYSGTLVFGYATRSTFGVLSARLRKPIPRAGGAGTARTARA